jgi:hypothetical protein
MKGPKRIFVFILWLAAVAAIAGGCRDTITFTVDCDVEVYVDETLQVIDSTNTFCYERR